MAIPIEKFQEQGGRLKTDDLDFEAFRRQPLPPHVLRCLAYMHDIEYQTVLYTRELLLLPAWKDPQFTAFLTLWNYEEYWHGQALGKVLAAHDWPAHDTRLVAMRRFNKRYLFWSPAIFWLLGHGVRKFPAVHMTWGAINEWTANAAYNRLAQIADHPVLTELLGRIMRQEGRHAAYYASYARDLLEGDPRAQRVTKWFLQHEWAVVGSGDVPKIETSFAAAYLFGSGDGAQLIERVEERIDALPGLRGLNLVRTGIAEATRHVCAEEGSVPVPPAVAHRVASHRIAS
ncbi:MAG: ferritin-like domain-containing protein [Acidimicrobiaceae bacterium]|nr:ferritin-like domain-containing protein [Acidimicrobiaceae bacterium]